jgi:hypothetical protein
MLQSAAADARQVIKIAATISAFRENATANKKTPGAIGIQESSARRTRRTVMANSIAPISAAV